MSYQRVQPAPDRFKLVYENINTHKRQRQFLAITSKDYEDPVIREKIIIDNMPGRQWVGWIVPYIYTVDTPSGDIEPGQVCEMVRGGKPTVFWCDQAGNIDVAETKDLAIAKNGDVIDVIERKPQ